jgi:H+-transporting ATPase
LVGLTSAAAARRLQQGGANAIADVARHPVVRALGKLWAPVPWMLEAAILLQLYTGAYIEAGVVGFLLVFNAALGFVQEGRAQATLDALKSQLALLASVRRDGVWVIVKAATIVDGDVVKLSLGAVVAADTRLATDGAVVYAGALVRRGEAVGQVVATGASTKFGRTAELVRSAKVVSSEQKAIVRVVRNLALFNGGVTIIMAGYAFALAMPGAELISLILVAVLASIPVALPSMFTLAAAVGARGLAAQGVLPTSLSAVDEAGSIDVLCADKTGTLTRNELAVTAVRAMPGFDEAMVLNLAALASSDGGQDPVDAAIRAEALCRPVVNAPRLVAFVPFDPAAKRSAATVRGSDGALTTVVKGAFGVVQGLSQATAKASATVAKLQNKGFRVLAVASGPEHALRMVGLIALSDPPREDSAGLVVQLRDLGV